jgi:hypothetical protein
MTLCEDLLRIIFDCKDGIFREFFSKGQIMVVPSIIINSIGNLLFQVFVLRSA